MASARATFQGLPCQSAVYENPYGLASGHGFAIMPAKEFVRAIDGDAWIPLGEAVGTSSRGGPAIEGSLQIRGDLAFYFANEDPVVLEDLYIGNAGVEVVRRSAERKKNRGMVRVPFMDIRALWATRGEVFGDYNVLLSTDGIPKPEAQSTGDTSARSGTTTPTAYDPDSLRPDGKPYTLTDMINICLGRLAGKPKLVGSAAAIAAADLIIPTQIRLSAGRLAVELLSDLLGAWHFKPGFDLTSGSFSIWKRGDGLPAVTNDGAVLTSCSFSAASSKSRGVALPPKRVTRWTLRTQPYYPAKAVRILGQPVVRERIRKLIAVGEFNGEIMPLERAAGKYGMSIDDLRRWVLLAPEAQENWKNGALGEAAIDAFRRWAYKWYALADEEKGVLPVLSQLARSTVDGVKRAPVVNADTFDEVRIKRAEIVADGLDAAQTRAAQQALDAVAKADAKEITPPPADLGSILGNLMASKEDAARLQADLELDEKVAAQANLNSVRQHTEAVKTILALNEQNEVTLSNRALATVNPARYTVEKDGVVKFDFHVGWIDIHRFQQQVTPDLRAHGVTSAELPTEKQVSLLDGARVILLFAFEDKPAAYPINISKFDKSRDVRFHYSYLAKKGGNGKVAQLNPGGLEPDDTSDLYVRIVRTDLRCYVDIAGNTNRADLDAAAAKIAERELDGDDQFSGVEGEVIGFFPIETTGAVATVTWEMQGARQLRAYTRWTVGEAAHIDHKQPGRIKIAGTAGISTPPGDVTNPAVNRQ